MRTLLDPNIDTAKIAKQRPLETNKSATFIVDIRSLKHCDNIKKDMISKWVHHGSPTDVFKCRFDELSNVHVEKAAQGASGDVFYLRRFHSTHPSNKHFRRIVALISGTYIYTCVTLHGWINSAAMHFVLHKDKKVRTTYYLKGTLQIAK